MATRCNRSGAHGGLLGANVATLTIKRLPGPQTNSKFVVVGDNHAPEVSSDTAGHVPTPTQAATATASSAARPRASGQATPGATTRPVTTPTAAANAAARARYRRRQPPAVVAPTTSDSRSGRPSNAPATVAPTTSAVYRRPAKQNDGNKAWLTRHLPHRARRTQIRKSAPTPSRTYRQYPPQNTIGDWQPAQHRRGAATFLPAAA